MPWKHKLIETFRIRYTIVQAPMLGVSTPEMAAAVSNAGGLGSIPVGGLSPEATRLLIQKTKTLTNQPFSVNLFAHQVPDCTEEQLAPMRRLLLQLAHKKGYVLNADDLTNFHFYTYHDQLEVLLEEEVSIISFTFGCLDVESIERLKIKGCTLIGTATSVEEAIYLEQRQIDVISVQGIEAGGHRGSFLNEGELPQVGLFALLPQIRKAVQTPCIAAGGITSASTMKAAFELGADAVQIGTAFIPTEESEAIPAYKENLLEASDVDTVLTKAFSGRWARGIKNEFMMELAEANIFIPPYPWQNSLTAKLRKLAQANNDSDYTNLWAGQSVVASELKKTKDVFLKLVHDYEAAYLHDR